MQFVKGWKGKNRREQVSGQLTEDEKMKKSYEAATEVHKFWKLKKIIRQISRKSRREEKTWMEFKDSIE